MNLGVIVEGPYDSETYPVIIRRIRPDVDRVYPVTCHGLRNLKNKFLAFLKVWDARRDLGISKVFVIRDSDCDPPAELEQELRQRLELSRVQPRFSVHFYATRCKLESWMLADEEAISCASLRRGGPGGVQQVSAALETLRAADALLLQVLRGAGLPPTPTVYAEIAAEARLLRIGQRCPYFREFVRRVEDC